ncbi:MAG TPA: hypothetical protein VGI78_23805 [Acetobacteraceae bacterium]|jgi:hypothetical protein
MVAITGGQMERLNWLPAGARVAFAAGALSIFTPGIDRASAAPMTLDDITAAADRLCNLVQTQGSSESVKYEGQVKAEVDGLLKRLGVDAGVSGNAARASSNYQGVLQNDLVTALHDNATCKLHVFDALVKALPQ